MKREVHIRLLQTLDEFRACQDVQKATWDLADLLIIPYTQLVSMQHNGGAVFGAFDGERLAGFVCGYLGRRPALSQSVYLYSQRMGVLPEYQGQGVGEQLKWAQRAWALQHGLERIVWTFDPLEPANARLNLAKLGGVARSYVRDFYGQHDTPLHRDVPSDRLVIDWELASERVAVRADSRGHAGTARAADPAPPINALSWDNRGRPHPTPADLEQAGPRLSIAVPAQWQALRRADIKLSLAWRMETRRAFEGYMGRGYKVTGYVCEPGGEPGCNAYQLEKSE